MMKRLSHKLFLLILSLLAVGASHADALPDRGLTKSAVQSEYGQPGSIEGPVGDPPITRWLYADFTVVFEYDHVLHAFPRQYDLESRPTASIPKRPDPGQGDTLNLPE